MRTTLPEKWYILRNKENHLKINKWFNENTIAHYTYFSKKETTCFPELNTPNAFVETKPHLGYLEITFPEFQVMVLEEFPENWNIEVSSKKQFDEVVSFLLNPKYKGTKFWEGKECGYNGGSRFIAIHTDNIGFTYNMVGYNEETRITWEQFKRLKAKQMGQIDYTIAGTPLPTIPSETEYRVVGWDGITNSTTGEEKAGLVSYGKTEYLGETYILAERPKYTSTIYYMFKLSTIQQLTKQNKMERKIIGYLCPTDLFTDSTIQLKGSMYIKCEGFSQFYKPEKDCPSKDFWLPREIVETWKPCYEEEYKAGDWITVINPKSGWVKDIEERTFKLVETPTTFSRGLAWSTSGPNNLNVDKGRYGICQEEFRKATPEEIAKATVITIGGYCAEIFTKPHSGKPITKYIKFGCQEFSLEELQAYLKLFNKDIKAKLTIHDVEITEELIQKLINKFK
jgi:hypothetical protein